jgi:hypothetical protein
VRESRNVALPPICYDTVEIARQHGHRTKKTLEIGPIQAETERLVFGLTREADSSFRPTAGRSVTEYLDATASARVMVDIRASAPCTSYSLEGRASVAERENETWCSANSVNERLARFI